MFCNKFIVCLLRIKCHVVLACDCSPHGSVREDCEQTNGRCMCKPGILGEKCDTCPDGSQVSSIGCDGRECIHYD